MKENQASITAILAAYKRAYHSMHDTADIFNDFLAYSLIPEEKLELIENVLTGAKQFDSLECIESHSDKTTSLMSFIKATNVIVRARYAEDNLEKAIRHGVKQYVILGAGLDTFAFRRPEMVKHLEVFEVDHPDTQEFKILRLAELGWKRPAQLHFIPVDFTQENLVTALTHSPSYNPKVKSFFSWLGVTMYLTRDEVYATLSSITDVAPPGSIVIFDYFDTDAFISEKSSSQMQKYRDVLQSICEPMITGFTPSTLAEDIASLGFRLNEELSPSDIGERYFKGRKDGYHAHEHWHIACATVN